MLKLDFNERADSLPTWLRDFKLDTTQLWKYPNRQEIEVLIAEKFNTSANNVFLSNGGDESIELLFKLCKLNNKSILLPLPAFSQYTHQLSIWGLDFITVDAQPDLSIDVKALSQQLKANQWLIVTRPNNPTGECISEAVVLDLIHQAKQCGTFVFLDEAYVEFFQQDDAQNYGLEFDHVISLRTFSKAFGLAGARLGYLLGNETLIAQFKKYAMPFNVNSLSLQTAKKALQNTEEMRVYCSNIAKNRQHIFDYLCSCGIEVFNGQGNFLLFKLNSQRQQILSSFLAKKDIQIKTQVNDLPDCLRLTVPEDITELMQVFQTVFQPNLIAFDMDGVLIDTSGSYDRCILETAHSFSNNQFTNNMISALRAQGGFNNDWDLTQGLLAQAGTVVEIKKIIKTFQQFYQVYKSEEINLLDNDDLFQGHYSTAIVTGRPKTEALDGVAQLNIKPDHIISADDVQHHKPSPEGLNNLKATTKKNRLWFCGDTVDDMQAGQAAEALCIGIGKDAENLYQAGADIVLENINQLEALL